MQIVSIELAHDCTLVLYKQLIQTGSVLQLLQKFSVLGFPLYEDTADDTIAVQALLSACPQPLAQHLGRNLKDRESGHRTLTSEQDRPKR